MRTTLLTLSLTLALVHTARAEVRQIWDSPAAQVAQTIGITDIRIEYYRPGVKGREIWGKLVPFGQVWRAGANEATRISFSTAVKIAGKPVPAGTYALFVLPSATRWTFILSKDAKQWGAYFHKPEHDLMRFEVTPQQSSPREWMAYELEPQGKSTVVAALSWDKLRASFPIEVDTDGLYQAYLAAEMGKADGLKDPEQRWEVYFSSAKYWIVRGEKLAEAGKLLDKADQLTMNAWSHEYRARLLVKQGKVAQALPLLDKAKAAAQGKFPKAYLDGIDKLRADWTAGRTK